MGKKKSDTDVAIATSFETDVCAYSGMPSAQKIHGEIKEYLAVQYPHIFVSTATTFLEKGTWARVVSTISGITDETEKKDIQEDIEDILNGTIPINLLHKRGG